MSSQLSQLLANNPVAGSLLQLADGFYLYDSSAAGSNKSAGVLLSEFVKSLRTRNAQANAAGDSTVTVGVLSLIHTEVITFSGAARTSKMVLAIPAGLSAGVRACVRCVVPATAGITVDFRNGTAGGTQITFFTTDDSGDDKCVEFEFDGAQWNFLRFDAYATP